jgi:hypothetical protein
MSAILKTEPEVSTSLLPGELAIVSSCRRRLDEAIGNHETAVERLNDAKVLANKLPSLRSQAGAIAAAAFGGGEEDKAAAKRVTDSIALAEHAQLAVGPLTDDVREADYAVAEARGALSAAVKATTFNTAKRAAARYHELAEQLTREVALMLAACERVLTTDQMSSVYGHHFLASLKVPAAPEQVRLTQQGTHTLDSLDLLIAPHHPRLVKETNVAAALIAHQLQAAGALK